MFWLIDKPKLRRELAEINDMGKNAGVVINKDRGDSGATEEVLRKNSLPVIFRIPYSMEIQRAYSRGVPLIRTMPEIGKKLKKLYEDISNGQTQ